MRTLVTLLVIGFAVSAQSAQYYASTTGSPGNPGTIGSPWDLNKAFTNSALVAGDTVWIRGGTYTHGVQGYIPGGYEGYIWRQSVSGNSGAQLLYRGYPGERATLDGGAFGFPFEYHANVRPVVEANGNYVTYQDLEFVSNSTEQRLSGSNASIPPDIFRVDGPYIHGLNVKFVNCIAHDMTGGFSIWKDSQASELYGNVIYNSGWQGAGNVHGHNVYAQHNTAASGLVTIKRNISLNPYAHGIQMYGSDIQVSRFRFTENIWVGKQGVHGGMLIGVKNGGAADRLQDNEITDNFGNGADFTMFYQADPNAYFSLRATGNYFKTCYVGASSWKNLVFTNNTFFVNPAAPGSLKMVSLTTNGTYIPWTWDRNSYYGNCFFGVEGHAFTAIGPWRTTTGYDLNSTVTLASPTTNYIIVQNNIYDTNRAQVAAYNWSGANFLAFDLSSLGWGTNTAIVVRNAQDYWTDAVAAVTTSTNTVVVDMRAASHTVAIPYGDTVATVPTTFPGFGAFILTKGTNAPPPPPPPPSFAVTVNSFNPSSGVTILYSPFDVNGLGDGVTSFSRTNTTNTVTSMTAPATASGNNFVRWDRNGVSYSTSAAITFTNTSDTTWTANYSTPTVTLTVTSGNPASGVFIQMAPADINGASNGNTPFTRTIVSGTVTTLTAPLASATGTAFSKWQLNGVDYVSTLAATYTNSANTVMNAVFVTTITPPSAGTGAAYSTRRRGAKL